MIQEGHLQIFDLILHVKSPLFIGCGKNYISKEYIFDPQTNMVSFLDEQNFFSFMAQHNMVDAYEKFMLSRSSKNLLDFLQSTCRLSQSQIKNLVRCKIDASQALDENHSLKEIQRMIRNSLGQVYIPGSSIKGALRTVLLTEQILLSPPHNPSPDLIFEKNSPFEDTYLHTLSLKKDKNQQVLRNNPLNSLLRGFYISDSFPITDQQLCLTQKTDGFTDGSYHTINTCRECIKPGTQIHCKLTLDQSILQEQITKEKINHAISVFSDYYQQNVITHYDQFKNYMNSKSILLGGGIGFQSKTVTYPYYHNDALSITSKILRRNFPKHYHEDDVAEGISPRALKLTKHNNTLYPYGVCEVSIQ